MFTLGLTFMLGQDSTQKQVRRRRGHGMMETARPCTKDEFRVKNFLLDYDRPRDFVTFQVSHTSLICWYSLLSMAPMHVGNFKDRVHLEATQSITNFKIYMFFKGWG